MASDSTAPSGITGSEAIPVTGRSARDPKWWTLTAVCTGVLMLLLTSPS